MNYDKNILEKKKESRRIHDCHWSPDGLFIAYGTFEGLCIIRDQEFNKILEIEHPKAVIIIFFTINRYIQKLIF
jgi:hypothetical protein